MEEERKNKREGEPSPSRLFFLSSSIIDREYYRGRGRPGNEANSFPLWCNFDSI